MSLKVLPTTMDSTGTRVSSLLQKVGEMSTQVLQIPPGYLSYWQIRKATYVLQQNYLPETFATKPYNTM